MDLKTYQAFEVELTCLRSFEKNHLIHIIIQIKLNYFEFLNELNKEYF